MPKALPEVLPEILNAAFYKFAPLGGGEFLAGLRARLLRRCRELGLKGTILLSPEGINGSLAGGESGLRRLVAEIEEEQAIGLLDVKLSRWNARPSGQPFGRMRVKIKKEIVPMGLEGVRPAEATGRRLSPRELRDWLAAGREFVLLDVRNEYEIGQGTFEGARSLGLSHFKECAARLGERRDELRDQTVVMFCTGGIRCEKATALALRDGWSDVFQLDGGILRYFEECGGHHYLGKCFVFDERGAIGPGEVASRLASEIGGKSR